MFDDLGFEAGELLGLDRVAVGPGTDLYRRVYAEHPRRVFGVTAVVLLAVRDPRARLRLHDDAGVRIVDARLPGAFGADLSVLGELLGVLAEVPDVAPAVLRVPVERFLGDAIPDANDIVHDDARNTEDLARLVRDLDRVGFGPVRSLHCVRPPRTRNEWEPRIVDRAAKVARIDLGRVARRRGCVCAGGR